jgi:hypothetical protein
VQSSKLLVFMKVVLTLTYYHGYWLRSTAKRTNHESSIVKLASAEEAYLVCHRQRRWQNQPIAGMRPPERQVWPAHPQCSSK